jgi:hypothetical protein
VTGGNIIGLESPAGCAYSLLMDDAQTPAIAPAGWLEALAESEADLAAGRIVPGDVVMRDLRESLARLEAKAATKTARKDTRRR